MSSYCGSALLALSFTTALFPLGRGEAAALRDVAGLWLRKLELRAQVCEQMGAGD